MALFGFGKKKKEEKKAPACTCPCSCSPSQVDVTERESDCSGDKKQAVCCIKVLGTGCASCHTLLENTKEAVETLGLSVEVVYVTEMQKIMKYGVMRLPALVVNEKVVSVGKVLKAADVKKLLYKLGAAGESHA